MADILKNAKQPLVLLHGWGLNRAAWDGILPLFAVDQPVLCLDLPGFGDRQSVPEPYLLRAIAEQLLPDIPEQSLLVGWSLGGLVAQEIAAISPNKVKALALVASSPCFVASEQWPGMESTVLSQFAQALQTDVVKTIERFMAIQAMGSETARQDIKRLKESVLGLPLPQEAALIGGLAILANTDLRQQMTLLECPISACFGRLDALVPVGIAALITTLVPTAEITIFAKASHAPFISHPAEFMQWLNAWLWRFGDEAASVAVK